MEKEEVKLIGVVGVDSGQLMITDPCYIDSEWIEHGFKGERHVRIMKGGEIIDAPTGTNGMTWNDEFRDSGMTWNEAIAKGLIEDMYQKETGEFSYDGCCKSTIKKSFGQLDFSKGHEGAGVVFTSGFGDGLYNVFATIKDFGEMGKRITKVEIIMIE